LVHEKGIWGKKITNVRIGLDEDELHPCNTPRKRVH